MTHYSLSIIPEIPGFYNWYSFWRGQEILARKPQHQYVDIKEAQDIYGKVVLLKEASLSAVASGVEMNAADFDGAMKLMNPEAKYDEEGQRKYFMALWKKQSEEEVSLKVSFNPTRKDLVSMTEEPPKNYYDSTAKEESKEEVNQSGYFDAENTEDGIPSPLASSSKKNNLRKL